MIWYEVQPNKLIDLNKLVYIWFIPEELKAVTYFIGINDALVFNLTQEEFTNLKSKFYGTV